jgi:hypothetical protein
MTFKGCAQYEYLLQLCLFLTSQRGRLLKAFSFLNRRSPVRKRESAAGSLALPMRLSGEVASMFHSLQDTRCRLEARFARRNA